MDAVECARMRKDIHRARYGAAKMTHTIETLKEMHEQRFAAGDKAIVLAVGEINRRLEVLNHSHEVAREKERSFINREAFEMIRQRVADDITLLRNETQTAANTSVSVRDSAIKTISDWCVDQNTKNEARFVKIEAVHSKILGGLVLGTFIIPLITGMVIYILTKGQ